MADPKTQWWQRPKSQNIPIDTLFSNSLEGNAGVNHVQVNEFFSELRDTGIQHRPAFQNLTTIRAAPRHGKAVCDFKISGLTSPSTATAASRNSWEYPIHPTTLDSAFQASYAALDKDFQKGFCCVPRSIGALYLLRGTKRLREQHLRAVAELNSKHHGRGFLSTVTVIDPDLDASSDLRYSMRIERLYCQAVPLEANNQEHISLTNLDCAEIQWVPGAWRGLAAGVKEPEQLHLTKTNSDWEEKIRQGAYYYIRDAVSQLHAEEQGEWMWNHKKLVKWMNRVISSELKSGVRIRTNQSWADHYNASSPEERQTFLDRLSSETLPGKLLCRIGARLGDILQGRITPLELMMEDGLLELYYHNLPCAVRSYQQIQTVVLLFSTKNPCAKILEVGAGTGAATTAVLAALGTTGAHNKEAVLGPGFAQYDFTDVSPAFFDKAQSKLAPWGSQGLMSFKRLDIEIDPEIQPEFGPDATKSYDLIIASLVLHATTNLERTMRNVWKLLKSGGTLIMTEGTQDKLDSQLIFGTLPGWWLSEEPEREMSPMVSLKTWNDILQNTGFPSGVELHSSNCAKDQYQSCSVLVTTADLGKTNYPQSFTLVYVDEALPGAWLAELRGIVRSRTGADMHLEHLSDLDSG
ncbi:hypothetical protein F4782DRAFT_536004 [Xylaria castorea]|nr:hypothetical protein F4782DRAFT_536004 [Xylaria castorea]